jgi:hypothetical protein
MDKIKTFEEHQNLLKELDTRKMENQPHAKRGRELACNAVELTRYRNERNLMLFPFCSTSKRKRLKAIEYRSSDGKRWLQVTANHSFGMAKIWDFDILRFAISKAGEIKHQIGYFPPFVEFSSYECLKALRRSVNTGPNYVWLEEALARLVSTTYRGNIFRDDSNLVDGFTLISCRYEKYGGRIQKIRMTFNERILESVRNDKGLLAIDFEVIQEESGIKKRLLELVKISKGINEEWVVGLDRLKEMCAHEGELKKFKSLLKSYELPWKVSITKKGDGRCKVIFSDS